jgi:hypothetical protein
MKEVGKKRWSVFANNDDDEVRKRYGWGGNK